MKKTSVAIILVSLAGLLLSGCQTAPVAVSPVKPKPVVEVEKDTFYKNISVSEAKGVSSPFKMQKGTVFPDNKMGYKLILSSDVSMPNLLATQLESKDIQVLMRIYNRGEDQTLNIICARGEDRNTYQAHGVFFPANRARDIKFTISQQDSQNLSLIVTPTR